MLFTGDDAMILNEYEDSKKAVTKRNVVQRDKQDIALQEKLRIRQKTNQRR